MRMLTVENVSPDTIVRLFRDIQIVEETGCWLWLGSCTEDGYGQVTLNNQRFKVHRFFYAWLKAPIPIGKGRNVPLIDHICETRNCCNPDHLRLVMPATNLKRSNGKRRRVFCKRGHRLPPPGPDGTRRCRECRKIRGD